MPIERGPQSVERLAEPDGGFLIGEVSPRFRPEELPGLHVAVVPELTGPEEVQERAKVNQRGLVGEVGEKAASLGPQVMRGVLAYREPLRLIGDVFSGPLKFGG